MERKNGNRVSYETPKSSLVLRFPPVSKGMKREMNLWDEQLVAMYISYK